MHALVRNTASFGHAHDQLTVFQGSALDHDDIAQAMQGCDAVVSTLNVSMASHFPWAKVLSPPDLMSASIKNATSVMKEQGLKRIVVMSSNGATETWSHLPAIYRGLANISNIKVIMQDHTRQEAILAGTDLDWTALRPVGLNDKKIKPLDEVTVSFDRNPKPAMMVARSVIAEYIVKTLENDLHIHERPTLS